MQYVSFIQSLPSVRPWVPWCVVATIGMIYVSLISCLDEFAHSIFNWEGMVHPTTLLCLVGGAGLITVPLYYASHIPFVVLCGALGYALMLLQYIVIHEHHIWIAPMARFLGVINVGMGLYITTHVVLNPCLNGRRGSIWTAYRLLLPLLILPQVILIVLTDPL